jgi:hypothetical protein
MDTKSSVDQGHLAPTDPLRSVLALMATQHGVASSAQARELGLDSHRERRALARGVVTRPLTGVLVAVGAPNTWFQDACITTLAAPRCALSHGAAARLHGLDGFRAWSTIEVLCPKGWWPTAPADTLIRFTRGLQASDVTMVNGIQVLTVATTLAMLAPVAGRAATELAVESALRQGYQGAELYQAAKRWRSRGRSGPATLLQILDRRVGAQA